MKRNSTLAAVGGLALLTAASMTLGSQEVIAADHIDGPAAIADNAADIADLYAWHTDDGKVVAIMTFAGLQLPGDDARYDGDLLYTLHIDNTAAATGLTDGMGSNGNDNTSDLQVHVRFGQNGNGEWGVQVTGLPGGADEVMEGPVDTTLDGGDGNMATAGTFDDPFFFDLDGFNATIANLSEDADDADVAFGSLADLGGKGVLPAPDALMGTNVHAIVLEFDMATALNKNPDGLLQIWATTGRISE